MENLLGVISWMILSDGIVDESSTVSISLHFRKEFSTDLKMSYLGYKTITDSISHYFSNKSQFINENKVF